MGAHSLGAMQAMKLCMLALMLATYVAADSAQVSPIEDEAMFVENSEAQEPSMESADSLVQAKWKTNTQGYLDVDDAKRWICWSVSTKRVKCARNNSANRARAKAAMRKMHKKKRKLKRKIRKKLGKPISKAAKKRHWVRKIKRAMKKARKKAKAIRKRKNKTWWHSIHKKDEVKGRQIKHLTRRKKSTSHVPFSTWKYYKNKVKKAGGSITRARKFRI